MMDGKQHERVSTVGSPATSTRCHRHNMGWQWAALHYMWCDEEVSVDDHIMVHIHHVVGEWSSTHYMMWFGV